MAGKKWTKEQLHEVEKLAVIDLLVDDAKKGGGPC
jgi:hypothetical protein